MSTSTARKRATWNPTPEWRTQRQQADERIRAEAAAVLADPAQVALLVDKLMQGKLGARVLSYSLANQALVLTQAAERAIPVSDVRGKGEWRRLGRWPSRGVPGLRIVARNSEPKKHGKRERTGDQAADVAEPQVATKPRGYHMASVWDVSMTTGDDAPAEPAVETHPAGVLLARLTEQAVGHGYDVIIGAPDGSGRVSNVDHDLRTITLGEHWSPRDRILTLALSLAQILTSYADEAAARAEEPAVTGGGKT